MNAYRTAALLGATLVSAIAAGELAPPTWPEGMKTAAVEGCRAAVFERAAQVYRKRNNVRTVPANFGEQIAPTLAPALAACDCTYDHLEREFPADFVRTQSEQAARRVDELASNECAVGAGGKSPTVSNVSAEQVPAK
jgi:hypothetical protein